MAARASSTPLPITANLDIEATINGYRWIFDPGTPRVITWSVSGSQWSHPTLQSAETQDDFGRMFSFISYYINASFSFLGYFESTSARPGYQAAAVAGSNMNISFAYDGPDTLGHYIVDGRFTSTAQTAFCNFPWTASDSQYPGAAGDTWLNWNNPFIRSLDFEVGTTGFALLLHEVLHGLGLKHPHDNGGTGRPTYADLNLPFIDRQWMSVMSYDRFETGGDGAYSGSMPIAPMIMDVIALQYLYGESTGGMGDSTHDLSILAGNYYNTLWDSSGTDTIDASKVTFGVFVQMSIGQASNGTRIHDIGYITTATDQVSLALLGFNPSHWTWLWGEYENFTGTVFDDSVSGNAFDNTLNGGDGNDVLIGGVGNDTFDWDPQQRRGADTFRGGLGDDRYVLDSVFDVVDEKSFEGIDTVYVGFNYSIEGTAVENLSAFSDASVGVRFTGSDFGNELTGGPQADTLVGLGGDDVIRGGAGADVLDGGAGRDWLLGGAGNDRIDAGAGVDIAGYSSVRTLFTIARSGAGWSVVDRTGAEGSDLLTGVERLNFTSSRLALDTSPGQSGHSVALILRALYGPQALQNQYFVGA